MGQFQLSGTIAIPDPSRWIPGGLAEVATYTDGAPLLQGQEWGTLVWDVLTYADFATLRTRWNANKAGLTAGALPEQSGSALGTYDTVTSAMWHEPVGEARGGLRFNVEMPVYRITRS